jgi:hypothetical protein
VGERNLKEPTLWSFKFFILIFRVTTQSLPWIKSIFAKWTYCGCIFNQPYLVKGQELGAAHWRVAQILPKPWMRVELILA